MHVILRAARLTDLDAIFAIYDHEVLHGTSTFDTEPYDVAARQRWHERHQNPTYPALVAEGPDGRVAGWASVSPWSDRRAYARLAEESVYVHRDHRGQGIGRLLLRGIIDAGRTAGVRVLLARITSESAASLALHESFGFARIGTMRRAGEKFGRVLDVTLLDLHLDG